MNIIKEYWICMGRIILYLYSADASNWEDKRFDGAYKSDSKKNGSYQRSKEPVIRIRNRGTIALQFLLSENP